MSNTVDNSEDTVRHVLERWDGETSQEIRSLAAKKERGPSPREDKTEVRLTMAKERRTLITLLSISLDRKELWKSVDHALMLGILEGISQSHPYTYHAERKLFKRSRRGGDIRGKAKRMEREQVHPLLLEKVEALHAKHALWSFNKVCTKIAATENESSSTVKRASKAIQWKRGSDR